MSSISCPVCATENNTEAPRRCGELEYYSCQRCGPFFLRFRSDDLSALLTKEKEGARLPRELTTDLGKIAALSHWIRTWYESHGREPTLDWELVKSIIKEPRPSLPDQADNYVRWIGDNVKVGGQYVTVEESAIQAIVGSATVQEFELVSTHLLRDARLIDHGESKNGVWRRVTLSFAGWERYRELKRATSDSRKAFMAMQYGNKELTDIFEEVFRDAVAKTGFDLFRLVDTPQPAGLIDDDLRVKIRASRFLIADLTDGNAGAYWEAGYAEGLGRPVIYTCEKKVFEDPESRPHFDTNHHLTILWEYDPDKRKEAGEKLKNTIRATLPAEAKLTDD